jgi:alkylation response protein AidB-like acyl-CoA dehydrogenase
VDFSLNQEQRAWQDKARKFAAEEIAPLSLERDAILDPFDAFDWEIIRKGSKLGFRTAVVSREEGGHGIDFVTQAVVMTELAKADSAIAKTFSQCWKWSHLIAAMCNDDQKQRFLEPFLADDTYVLGFGATEPNGGSDNRMPPPGDVKAGLRLSGRVEGDHMILNGDKAFIANGSIAKLFFVYVRTDPTVPIGQGTTLMMIPRDTPGFRHGKVFNKSGWRFYQNAELIFENARVPMANMVGELNGALRRREGEVGGDLFGDLELAANGLGICDAACDKAMALVRARRNGGALKDQQLIQLKIGRMKMLTEALRSYVLRVAWEHDRHNLTTNAGLVMNLATDFIQEVTELGMDVFDRAGTPMDRGIDKLVRDTFIWSHLAGDSVQRLKVARRVLSQEKFNLI